MISLGNHLLEYFNMRGSIIDETTFLLYINI